LAVSIIDFVRERGFIMNIKKIISGGQTGADRAALDFAIENDISHGGWVPKGRLAEDGVIPDRYDLVETESPDYNVRTEMNVMDSDGTLIMSHGRLTGGSALTKAFAGKHKRPCLHIDLENAVEFEAAVEISAWISRHHIETLNVAGSRASKDPGIYGATFNILETVFYMGIIEDNMPDFVNRPYEMDGREMGRSMPSSVDEAVDRLIAEMPLKDKVMIAGLREQDLLYQFGSLDIYIRNYYGLSSGNDRLMQSCRDLAGRKNLDTDEAVFLIIKRLWEILKTTHAIRRVK
jgi:hypothetical protein